MRDQKKKKKIEESFVYKTLNNNALDLSAW